MSTAADRLIPSSTDISDYQANNRALDFLSIRHACPKGMYLSPLPDDPSQWQGVLFIRNGPYTPAVFRFAITFPVQYPKRPPAISFLSDVFHPLISPLTTYLFSNQDTGADTVSASDHDRLSPGSFSLKHGFPEWFRRPSGLFAAERDGLSLHPDVREGDPIGAPQAFQPPHIAVILYYLRASFTSADLLNAIPLDAAANPSAWHAWRTFSSKNGVRSSSLRSNATMTPISAVKQQPGGARSPGEWNWDGVWEDRLRKCIQSSLSEQAIFKKHEKSDDLIQFHDLDQETLRNLAWCASAADSDVPA